MADNDCPMAGVRGRATVGSVGRRTGISRIWFFNIALPKKTRPAFRGLCVPIGTASPTKSNPAQKTPAMTDGDV